MLIRRNEERSRKSPFSSARSRNWSVLQSGADWLVFPLCDPSWAESDRSRETRPIKADRRKEHLDKDQTGSRRSRETGKVGQIGALAMGCPTCRCSWAIPLVAGAGIITWDGTQDDSSANQGIGGHGADWMPSYRVELSAAKHNN
jgi:hypothetical protein